MKDYVNYKNKGNKFKICNLVCLIYSDNEINQSDDTTRATSVSGSSVAFSMQEDLNQVKDKTTHHP